MTIAVIILSVLLLMSLIVIVVIGTNEKWTLGEWLGVVLFILCFPVWVVVKVAVNIKGRLTEKKRRGGK